MEDCSMPAPIEYTFWGYWWDIIIKLPQMLFYSWRAVVTIPLFIIFFVALYNRQIAEYWFKKWKGISPWWSVFIIAIVLLWGVMGAIYERHKDLFSAYKRAEEKAIKSEQKNTASLDYYLISKDGTILKNIKLDKYGLFVTKTTKDLIVLNKTIKCPIYILRFKNSPAYFDVTTRQRATPEVKQIDTNTYEVEFTAAGYGNPVVECDFKVQIY
jgi:hypothetical protein